jgi:K+-sensing histidine kinase KdpD
VIASNSKLLITKILSEKVKPEFERLQNFEKDTLATERKEAEQSLFEQFDEKLKGTEEYEELKKNASTFSMDALEKECFVILGKKNANFSAKQPAKKDKVKIEFTKTNETVGEYDELFEKYLNKNN